MSAVEYEFQCPHCDQAVGLTTRQAGQEIQCAACQKTFSVPTLGQLKQLPIMGGSDPIKENQQGKQTKPGSRNTIFVAGLLLLVFGVGSAFALQSYARNELIVDYNVEGAMDRMDPYVDELSPFEVAFLFDSMNVEKGLGEWKELPHVASTKQGNILMKIAYGLYAAGGLGLLLLISSFFTE